MVLDSSRLKHAVAVVDEAVRSGPYPGAVLAVTGREGAAWTHVAPGPGGVGLETIFSVASLTKPVVALAVMRLVERGLLLLSDPVARHIPPFAQNGKERVTVWHLLTHTSGLAVPEPVERALWEDRASPGRHLEAALAAPLAFEPGARHAYANPPFEVLAELVSRLSGQPHPHYLRDEVFAPLRMADTGFAPADSARAAPSRWMGSPGDLAYFTSLASGAGGLWSTAADLLALGRCLLAGGRLGGHRLLSTAALETMTRYHTAAISSEVDGQLRPANQGLGWARRGATGVMLASEGSFGHSGATGAFLWVDPERDLAFVFLSAEGGPESHHAPIRALNAVYGALERAE